MADPKKLGFPSKPCPKCGKAIHARSLSHEDCGWKARKAGRPAAANSVARQIAISIDDIKAVKDLAERIGVEKLRQLATLLAD